MIYILFNYKTMYKLLLRNYSKQISPKYIPSKNKTWCYKKGYYQIPDKKKVSHVSKNLLDSTDLSIIDIYLNEINDEINDKINFEKKNYDKKKISHVSKNLNKSIINYYDNIYKNN